MDTIHLFFDLNDPKHRELLKGFAKEVFTDLLNDKRIELVQKPLEDETWTIDDVKQHFKVKRHQVYNYIKNMGMPCKGGKPLKFSKVAVLQWEDQVLHQFRNKTSCKNK